MSNRLRFVTLILLLATIAPVNASRCRCRHPQKGDGTRWGGNEMVVQVSQERYRQMIGIVRLGDDPTAEVLVEVFDNPSYLVDQSALGSHPNQTRLRACVTGDGGQFCFRNLPSGKYELRASLSTGVNVTHVYIVIDSKSGSKQPIDVRMTVGT